MSKKKRSRLALPYKEYQKLCTKVLHRDGYKCRVCRSRNNLTVHHIIFRSHQGDDAEWNLITVCNRCHNGIHKPNPTTGAMLILMPIEEGKPIDANSDVKFYFANGWKPYDSKGTNNFPRNFRRQGR